MKAKREEMAALKDAVRLARGRSDLWRHRDWCDYRLDVMKGCFACRACDCPQDNGGPGKEEAA